MKQRTQKLIYICMPYSEDPVKSQLDSVSICKMLTKYNADTLPIAPQIYLHQFMDESADRKSIMDKCLELLSLCDQILVCGDKISEGMKEEIEQAHILGMRPINYAVTNVDALMWDLDTHFPNDEEDGA